MTEEQRKFKEKMKKDLGYDVDFSTYVITRGRGWSKADGSCGASIDANFTGEAGTIRTTLLLMYPLRTYNRKKYRLVEVENIRTGFYTIEIEENNKEDK